MQRAVITGATSMIGVAVTNACIQSGVEVLAIVRKNSPHIDRLPKSELVRVCERDLDELNAVAGGDTPYDVFYHMAWGHTARAQRDDPILQERNIRYTLDAVEAARKLGCKKFIGAGSQAEYGPVDGVIRPDTPVHPATAYGMAKYAAGRLSEKLCAQYGMAHVWARIFSVYGRHDTDGSMLSYAIERFIRGETAEFSPATQMWDFLHEDDAGQIFYRLGERAAANGVYCVAGGGARPLKEYIFETATVFGPDVKCTFASPDGGVPPGLEADISALVADIGYRPQTPFKQGIADMIQYRRQRGCRG